MVIGTTTDEMRLFVDVSGPPPERAKLCRRVARYAGVDEADASAIVVDVRSSSFGTAPTPTRSGPRCSPTWRCSNRPRRCATRSVRTDPCSRTCSGGRRPTRSLGVCHGIDIPFTFGNFIDGWAEFVGARRRRPRAVDARSATRGPRSRATAIRVGRRRRQRCDSIAIPGRRRSVARPARVTAEGAVAALLPAKSSIGRGGLARARARPRRTRPRARRRLPLRRGERWKSASHGSMPLREQAVGPCPEVGLDELDLGAHRLTDRGSRARPPSAPPGR